MCRRKKIWQSGMRNHIFCVRTMIELYTINHWACNRCSICKVICRMLTALLSHGSLNQPWSSRVLIHVNAFMDFESIHFINVCSLPIELWRYFSFCSSWKTWQYRFLIFWKICSVIHNCLSAVEVYNKVCKEICFLVRYHVSISWDLHTKSWKNLRPSQMCPLFCLI